MKSIWDKAKYFIILFIVSLFIIHPFLGSNYVAGNDTDFHVANVYTIYKCITNGSLGLDQILPVIGNNFGYGIGLFYPRMPHLISAYITVLMSGNVIAALKIIHFLVYFLAAIMMYMLVKTVFNNKFVALIAAIFYISFPYSITEVFVRDSLAESFTYIFMPMIILGLYELFNGNKRNFYIWFILGYVGIINSHLVLSVYFTIFICIYILLNIKKVFLNKNYIALLIAAVTILLITAPFTMPLVENRAQGIYHVFVSDKMSNKETLVYSQMGLKDFLVQKQNEDFSGVTIYLNLLAVVLAIVTLIRCKKIVKNKAETIFVIFLSLVAVIAIFAMSKLFPWDKMPKMMDMIQFVWRMEIFLTLALSILAALAFRNINSTKFKILCLTIILAFNGFTVHNAYDFDLIKQYNINDIDISRDGMGWEREYLPECTIQNLDYFENRSNTVIVKKGMIDEIKVTENIAPNMSINIKGVNKNAVIELPRIYYLGYDAKLYQNNGNVINLNLYMNKNGFIETNVNTDGTIVLKYKGTTVEKISNLVCILTILAILLKIVWSVYKWRKSGKSS